MKRLQLSLRDLFWLMLVVAIAVGWQVDHVGTSEELRRLSMHWHSGGPVERIEPSAESVARIELMKELKQLSNAQLSERLGEMLDRGSFRRGPEFQPCLVEMARRGMHHELQRHYDRAMTQKDNIRGLLLFPDNRDFLTALRRAQGLPDPLKIHVTLPQVDYRGIATSAPYIRTCVENVDPKHEFAFFSDLGRNEGWQVVLISSTDERVPDSNFRGTPTESFGFRLSSFGPLEFGRRGGDINMLDVRRYAKAPTPGRYQLQVFQGNGVIADEPNLDGLIVLKSEPVDVIVEWPYGVQTDNSFIPSLAVLSVSVAVAGWLVVRRMRKSRGGNAASLLRRRDVAWMVLVMVLAAGWLADNRRQTGQMQRLEPDAESNWTMRLAE